MRKPLMTIKKKRLISNYITIGFARVFIGLIVDFVFNKYAVKEYALKYLGKDSENTFAQISFDKKTKILTIEFSGEPSYGGKNKSIFCDFKKDGKMTMSKIVLRNYGIKPKLLFENNQMIKRDFKFTAEIDSKSGNKKVKIDLKGESDADPIYNC